MVNATVVLTGVVGRVGTISFTQEGNGTTTVEGNISGVTPGDHALVIHTYGNVNNVWITTGAPFKPAGTKGVIDNITVDVDGTATFKIYGKAREMTKEAKPVSIECSGNFDCKVICDRCKHYKCRAHFCECT
ncbi:superoxide dismutase [Cu-Zn] 1-like [Citrus clementina]|uniref:superoxide dismutase [Cu-Zn] 1-like n=1 Tax=Citrus clementina TaxID=85681 RepID=UPI000CED5BA7|nr:superoxide dismutase [Cu-Zn] 1-like [Citrus x clementina]